MTVNLRRRRDRKRASHTRVWLNGVEVTSRCFYADGRRGVVRCFVMTADGKVVLDLVRHELKVEELRGKVRWGWRA